MTLKWEFDRSKRLETPLSDMEDISVGCTEWLKSFSSLAFFFLNRILAESSKPMSE
jgi:hypothetical protein